VEKLDLSAKGNQLGFYLLAPIYVYVIYIYFVRRTFLSSLKTNLDTVLTLCLLGICSFHPTQNRLNELNIMHSSSAFLPHTISRPDCKWNAWSFFSACSLFLFFLILFLWERTMSVSHGQKNWVNYGHNSLLRPFSRECLSLPQNKLQLHVHINHFFVFLLLFVLVRGSMRGVIKLKTIMKIIGIFLFFFIFHCWHLLLNGQAICLI